MAPFLQNVMNIIGDAQPNDTEWNSYSTGIGKALWDYKVQ
jgi:hypothetical protein